MNRRMFTAGISSVFAVSRSEAGGPIYAADVPGKWRPWAINDDAYANDFAPNKAEQREFFDNLARLAEPLRTHPAYANPVGYEIAPYRGIRGDYRDKPPRPIPGHLTLQTFFYFRQNDNVIVGGESPVTLRIFANSLRVFLGPKFIDDETETLCFAPTARDNTVRVHSRWTTGWALSKRTAPLFIPATRERLLRARIYQSKKDIGRAPANDLQRRTLDDHENALARMSSAERSAPAFVSTQDWRKETHEHAKDAGALVVPNPHFYDPQLPRTALQVLCVPPIRASFAGADEPPVAALRSLIHRKFDHRALQALLS